MTISLTKEIERVAKHLGCGVAKPHPYLGH